MLGMFICSPSIWMLYAIGSANEPQFGKQAVFLENMDDEVDLAAAITRLPALADEGINIVAPPFWALVTLNNEKKIIPSEYALTAKPEDCKSSPGHSNVQSGSKTAEVGITRVSKRPSTMTAMPWYCWMRSPKTSASWEYFQTGRQPPPIMLTA